MRPTLRQLEYIVTVARLGRFGQAAEVLNVSQPSLSAQIATAEEDLGVRLFHRSRSGVRVTGIGQEVIRRAQSILRDVQDLRAVAAGDTPFGGLLRLGVLPSIGPYLLPQVVRNLHQAHPNLRIILRDESTHALESGLRSGRFDMIISTPQDHPGTLSRPLFTEHLWIAVAQDDPLAQGTGPLQLHDLQDRVFLTLDPGHRLSHIVHRLAADCNGVISEEYEGTSMDAIRLMAASGAGLAVLPDLYARVQGMQGGEVVLRPLSEDQASRDIALLQPDGAAEMRGTELLTDVLLAEAKRLSLHEPAQPQRQPSPETPSTSHTPQDQ